MLDGLDEVKKEQRNACINAINDFRKERGLIQIAVCCRSEEYSELNTKLDFEGAIAIQPLTSEKVDEYFYRFDNRLAGIRNLLNKDTTLHELTQTPLMLSVMTLTYLDMPKEDIQIKGDIETQRKQIFDTYISRMFERPGRAQTNQFPKEKTLHWLSYLARKMIQHNEVPFLIENLQPNWLDEDSQQRSYNVNSRITNGLVFGLVFGLITGLLASLLVRILENRSKGGLDYLVKPAGVLSWSWKEFIKELKSDLLGGLGAGLIIGLVAGLVFGGQSVIHHYLLRYFLTHGSNDLPWRLIPFLDYAADLIFLRKIGGGYIFIHRLIMEHFANMKT